jgi:pyruvate/2-oxoglutarate/acetoin dehydrogenase E1 component
MRSDMLKEDIETLPHRALLLSSGLKEEDFDLIAESVKKTFHVLIVHEACLTGGFGAEIGARIGEDLFDYLDAPVLRVGAKDVPIPFSPVLESFVLPQTDDIIEGVKGVLNH